MTIPNGLIYRRILCQSGGEMMEQKQDSLGHTDEVRGRREFEPLLSVAQEAGEQRFRMLANFAPVGIFQTTPQGDCVFVNARWCALAGLTPEEAQGRGWVRALHPEDRNRVFEEWYESALAGREFQSDYRFQTPDNRVTWLQGHSVALRDESGRITGYLGTISDITERKRATEALRQSEERFRQLAENINEVFWASDLQKNLMEYVSPAYEQIWGRSCQSLYENPKSFLDAIDRQDLDRVIADAIVPQARGESSDVEYRIVRPDGSRRWIRDRSFPIKDQAGRVCRMVGIAEDITDRKQAEEAVCSLLRISERLNSSLDVDRLLEILVQEAISLVGAESGVAGVYTPAGMVSKKYFQKGNVIPLGYTWPPMHGLPGWLIVHKVPYLTNEASADKQIVPELCVQFGVDSALSTPILNASGDILGFFELHNKPGGFMDSDKDKVLAVSHAASIAIENARLYQEVQQSDRRKDEFLATLAHELRNPLAPIRAGLEVMKLAKSDPETLDEIRNTMERQTKQIIALVDDLLDVSRITRGKLELRKCRVRLSDVIESALEASKPFADEAGHTLSVTIPDVPIDLDADPHRLAQVVSNLLNNAVKYTPEGGHIWLTAHLDGDRVDLSVQDDGIGIPGDMIDRIFELFTQIDRPMEKGYTGLGIGLTLVKSLVELHGGTIEVESDGANCGSRFQVRLPILLEAKPPEKPSLPTEPANETQKRRVLIVDDNKAAADMLGMIVKMLGNDVRTAGDGQEGIEVAAEFLPDVVLMDLGMPRMNGYEAARHLRQQEWGQHILLIALTGWGQEEDKQRTKDAGFDHHLIKPAEPSELKHLLAEAGSKRTK